MQGKLLGADDTLYVFGPFTLDLVSGVLLRDGTTVPLSGRSLELLAVLLKRRGELLSKDELLAAVWPGAVVDENNLARHISNLRKVLSDSTERHDFIVTVSGRGYRFVAVVLEVRRADFAPNPQPAVPQPPAVEPVREKEIPAESTPPLDVAAPASIEPRTPRIRPAWVAAAAAVAAVIAATAWVYSYHPSSNTTETERRLWQLTSDPGVQMEPVWSPDSRRIAYTADREGNSDVWVQSLDSDATTRLTSSSAQDWQPSWSPDGRFIVFRSERDGGGLYVVAANGGPERRLTDFGYGPEWSPTGEHILFFSEPPGSRGAAAYLVSLDGKPPRILRPSFSTAFSRVRVHWMPDGKRLSIWGEHREVGWSFWTRTLDDPTLVRSLPNPDIERQLRDEELVLRDFAWSPRGDALFFESQEHGASTLWRAGIDPQTLAWTGTFERLKTGAERSTHLAVSPDGTKIAFSLRNAQTGLWALPFDPIAGRVVGTGREIVAEGADVPYDVSPDGREVVYRTVRRLEQQLWRRSLADGESALLVSGPSIGAPRFSYDGRSIVFRRASQVVDIDAPVDQEVVMLAATGGPEQLLVSATQSPYRNLLVPFDRSSDGQRLLTPCKLEGQKEFGVCTLPLSNAPHAEQTMQLVVALPDHNVFQGQFSPDNRFISFNATPARSAGNSKIYVVPAQGGTPVSITDGTFWDDKPRWAPDGQTIYYVSRRDGFVNVWGRRFDRSSGRPVGTAFRVTNFETTSRYLYPNLGAMHVAVARDQLVLPITTASSSIWILENPN